MDLLVGDNLTKWCANIYFFSGFYKSFGKLRSTAQPTWKLNNVRLWIHLLRIAFWMQGAQLSAQEGIATALIGLPDVWITMSVCNSNSWFYLIAFAVCLTLIKSIHLFAFLSRVFGRILWLGRKILVRFYHISVRFQPILVRSATSSILVKFRFDFG